MRKTAYRPGKGLRNTGPVTEAAAPFTPSAGGTRRLQMCGDCRVVDMMENSAEASIHDFKK